MLFTSINKQVENQYEDIKSDKCADDSDDNDNVNEEDDKDEVEDDLVKDLECLTLETEPDCKNIGRQEVYTSRSDFIAMRHYSNIIIPPPNNKV